jgi:hypothetical protein
LWWLNLKASYIIPSLQNVFLRFLALKAPADVIAAIDKNGQIASISKSKSLMVVRMVDATENFVEV